MFLQESPNCKKNKYFIKKLRLSGEGDKTHVEGKHCKGSENKRERRKIGSLCCNPSRCNRPRDVTDCYTVVQNI